MRTTAVVLTFAAVIGGVAVLSARPQSGTPIASKFPGPEESFAVASVKPNRSGAERWDFDTPPGRVVGTNVVLRDLIRFAYNIFGGDWDIRIAGPDWIKTDRYDIEATTGVQVPQPRAMSMLRRMLADRFGLRVHYENRERPVYVMVLARADGRLGPQLQRSSVDCKSMQTAMEAARAAGTPLPFGPSEPGKRPVCGSNGGPGFVSSGALSMEQLALQLVRLVGRPVLNRTDLSGAFDWDLKWAPEPLSATAATSAAPSIFTAVEEQLGLKLEPGKGPVEVLVIDSVERPTPD